MSVNNISNTGISFSENDRVEDIPSSEINYNAANPVAKLLSFMEKASVFAAEYNFYLHDSIQYLFPFSHLTLYGPSGDSHDQLDPRLQDNKNDFQKQNIKDFLLTDTYLTRGWVDLGNQQFPFVKISYTGSADSVLSQNAAGELGSRILLWISINGKESGSLLPVHYHEETDRYEIEIWGINSLSETDEFSIQAKKAFDEGKIVFRPDLVQGSASDFKIEQLENRDIYQVAPHHTIHPVNTCHIALAWADPTKVFWDSNFGKNYHYEFSMLLRGWENFIQGGVSGNPHGGFGFLHYRNLFSNYKDYSVKSELSRKVMPWMFDADGNKPAQVHTESPLSVDYVDLHILKSDCAIGIHRHRDNQEVFFLISGKALMIVGDWYEQQGRERAFEVRTLLPGSMALLKAGQLHALVNALDVDSTLLMFGGYD